MGFRPPKGVRPPQLEGKRTGRPKGIRNHFRAWADVDWARDHMHAERAAPPNDNALLWWRFARCFPDEFMVWVENGGKPPSDEDWC